MLNLLTPEDRSAVVRAYTARRATIILVFVASLLAIAAIVQAVFLITLGYQDRRIEQALARAQEPAGRELTRNIETARRAVVASRLVMMSGRLGSPAQLIARAVTVRPAGLPLTAFVYEEDEKGNRALAVSGTANSQTMFQTYVTALKESGSFSAVTSPVANQPQDRNLDFTVILTPAASSSHL